MTVALELWKHRYYPAHTLNGALSYAGMKVSFAYGAAVKAYLMATAAACIAALLVMTPRERNAVTYIGENSLGVYMLQAMLFVGLKVMPMPDVRMLYYGFFMAGAAAVFCLVTGLPAISRLLGYPGELLARPLKPKA